MSVGLPSMVHQDGIQKYRQAKFAGYDHNLGADGGALWDMENLTGELYPLLSPRRRRWIAARLDKPNGFYACRTANCGGRERQNKKQGKAGGKQHKQKGSRIGAKGRQNEGEEEEAGSLAGGTEELRGREGTARGA